MSLAGQVAIVTGGTKGIGLAIATELAARDADVICAARTEPKELPALPMGSEGSLSYMWLDVTDPELVSTAIDGIVTARGRIDILATCAGINRPGKVERLSADHWVEMLDVNLSGTFFAVRAVIPHMRRASYGRIVTVSSVVTRWAEIGTAGYSATKAGIEQFTRVVASEYGRDGIYVNGVAPGVIEAGLGLDVIRNPQIWERYRDRLALGRAGQPEEVARVVAFLSSPENTYVNGHTVEVNGGLLC